MFLDILSLATCPLNGCMVIPPCYGTCLICQGKRNLSQGIFKSKFQVWLLSTCKFEISTKEGNGHTDKVTIWNFIIMKNIIAIIGCNKIVHIALMLPCCSHHIPTINNYTTYLHLRQHLPLVKFSTSSSLICCTFRCIILCSLPYMGIKAHQSILSQYTTAIQTAKKLASAALFVAHYKLISNPTKKFH